MRASRLVSLLLLLQARRRIAAQELSAELEVSVRTIYRKAPREVNRTIAPLGLVLKAGRWYLVARCGEDVRTYRVGNILKLVVLDERFDWSDGFDLVEFWQNRRRGRGARTAGAAGQIRRDRPGTGRYVCRAAERGGPAVRERGGLTCALRAVCLSGAAARCCLR